MFRFSYGPSHRDRLDGRWVGAFNVTYASFSHYLDLLQEMAAVVREPWDKDGVCLLPPGMIEVESSCPWTGAFLLKQDGRRRKEDVAGMGAMLIADKDDGNLSVADLRAAFPNTPCGFHTTTKSRKAAQRWRVILATDREYSVTEHDSLFRWLDDLLGVDPQTKNHNRCQYAPSQWTSADNEFARFDQSGVPLNVDAIVAAYPPIIEAPPVPDVTLGSAPDCVTVITPAMIAIEGAKPSGGRLFRTMCAAAHRFKRNGWTLTASQLAYAATMANSLISPGKRRNDLERQAQRAIDWIASHVETIPAIPHDYFLTRIGDHYAKHITRPFQK